MAREITIDFTGAPPAQGSRGSDKVDPGRYLAEVKQVSEGTTQAGGQKLDLELIIVRGEANGDQYKGAKLTDIFAMPTQEKPQIFGKQRFNAFLTALGLNPGTGKVKIDLDSLAKRQCLVEVRDEILPANGQYAARTVSKVDKYFAIRKAAPKAAEPAPAVAPAPAPAPVEAAPAVAAAPAAADDVADLAESVDDLFS